MTREFQMTNDKGESVGVEPLFESGGWELRLKSYTESTEMWVNDK